MNPTDPQRGLRLQVRALWGCVIVFACAAAAANVRPLHVSNADNTPDTDVSLSSAHWTGTLNAARLPAGVARLDDSENLSLPSTLIVPAIVTSQIYSNGGDPSIDLSDPSKGYLVMDGTPELDWTYNAVNVLTTLTWDGGLSGSSGGGDVYLGSNLYIGSSLPGAGIYGPSGVCWVDNNYGGWFGPNGMQIDSEGIIGATSYYADADLTIMGNTYLGDGLTLGQTFGAGTLTPDRYFTVYDAGGAAYRVLCVAQ